MGNVMRKPLTVEKEPALTYSVYPQKIDEKLPEYIKDRIREKIRMNQRIKYLSMILHW